MLILVVVVLLPPSVRVSRYHTPAKSQPAQNRPSHVPGEMADAAEAPPSKRQRLEAAFEAQGEEGRRKRQHLCCSMCLGPFDEPVSVKPLGNTYCKGCGVFFTIIHTNTKVEHCNNKIKQAMRNSILSNHVSTNSTVSHLIHVMQTVNIF